LLRYSNGCSICARVIQSFSVMAEVSTLAGIGRLNCNALNNSELWSMDMQRAPRAMNAKPILLIG
jgi:hypothetical protein